MLKLITVLILAATITGCASPSIHYSPQSGLPFSTLNFVLKSQDIPIVSIIKSDLNDCEMKKTIRLGGLDTDSTETKIQIEAGQPFTMIVAAFRIPIPQAYMAGWSCEQAITFLPAADKNYELVAKLEGGGCQSELFEIIKSTYNKDIRLRESTQKLLPMYNHAEEDHRSSLCR